MKTDPPPPNSKNLPKTKKKKLYGVGPVDNRPSTDKLYHFDPQPKKIIKMT